MLCNLSLQASDFETQYTVRSVHCHLSLNMLCTEFFLAAWYLLLDTCCLILAAWYLLLDTCCLILAAWYLLLDTSCLILATCYKLLDTLHLFLTYLFLVEDDGIEPTTPCLQSRCSPSWANPPSGNTLQPTWAHHTICYPCVFGLLAWLCLARTPNTWRFVGGSGWTRTNDPRLIKTVL